MDRRTFLRGLGLAVGSGLIARCIPAQPSGPPSAPPGDAIVIGAGASGLAAARRLASVGQRVVVLEARDRIGGRAWTSEELGPPIDLGASWIHGTTDNPITQLARDAGLQFIPTNFDSFGTHDVDGRLLREIEEEPIYQHWLDLSAALDRMSRGPAADQSVAAAFEAAQRAPGWSSLDGIDPELVERYLAWSASLELGEDRAADLTELSLRTYQDGVEFGGPWVMLDGGYHAVFAPIADALDIRFGERVTAIVADGSGVTVTTDGGMHRADRVVVTVSLGVLKAGDISFTPPLPEATQAAIGRLGMGDFLKAVMRFPTPVWPGGQDWLGRLGETVFGEFVDLRAVTGEQIAVGFAAGSQARRLETLGDDAILGEAHAALGAALGRNDLPEPEAGLVTRWAQDPFARGSYSFLAVGSTPDDRDALAVPPGQRLILAGEATSRAHPSTVAGAWLSGEAAADRLLSGA